MANMNITSSSTIGHDKSFSGEVENQTESVDLLRFRRIQAIKMSRRLNREKRKERPLHRESISINQLCSEKSEVGSTKTHEKLQIGSSNCKQQPQTPKSNHSCAKSTNEFLNEQCVQQKRLRLLQQILENAVKTRNRPLVVKLLENTSILNPEKLGRMLWISVLKDEIEIACLLVEAGADLNSTLPFDEDKLSILHELMKVGDFRYNQLALLMLKYGADVNKYDRQGRSVIYYAIEKKSSIDLIEQFLKRGARIACGEVIVSSMHPSATELFSLFLTSDLVDHEMRKKIVTEMLIYFKLVVKDEIEILNTLRIVFDTKLSIAEITYRNGIFQFGIQTNQIKLVQLLMEYGIDVNYTCAFRSSPLYTASALKQSTISELLIQAGAKVNAPSIKLIGVYIAYPIHAACEYESAENIQLLLRHGANINVIDGEGHTPFSLIKFTGLIKEAHRAVIEHFVILSSRGMCINNCDLRIIQNHPELYKYALVCANELNVMKKTSIINGISFFCVFEKSVGELSFLTRNANLVHNYTIKRHGKFPIFYEIMDFLFENARMRKNLLMDKENALCETLQHTLPHIPLEKIVYYLYADDTQ